MVINYERGSSQYQIEITGFVLSGQDMVLAKGGARTTYSSDDVYYPYSDLIRSSFEVTIHGRNISIILPYLAEQKDLKVTHKKDGVVIFRGFLDPKDINIERGYIDKVRFIFADLFELLNNTKIIRYDKLVPYQGTFICKGRYYLIYYFLFYMLKDVGIVDSVNDMQKHINVKIRTDKYVDDTSIGIDIKQYCDQNMSITEALKDIMKGLRATCFLRGDVIHIVDFCNDYTKLSSYDLDGLITNYNSESFLNNGYNVTTQDNYNENLLFNGDVNCAFSSGFFPSWNIRVYEESGAVKTKMIVDNNLSASWIFDTGVSWTTKEGGKYSGLFKLSVNYVQEMLLTNYDAEYGVKFGIYYISEVSKHYRLNSDGSWTYLFFSSATGGDYFNEGFLTVDENQRYTGEMYTALNRGEDFIAGEFKSMDFSQEIAFHKPIDYGAEENGYYYVILTSGSYFLNLTDFEKAITGCKLEIVENGIQSKIKRGVSFPAINDTKRKEIEKYAHFVAGKHGVHYKGFLYTEDEKDYESDILTKYNEFTNSNKHTIKFKGFHDLDINNEFTKSSLRLFPTRLSVNHESGYCSGEFLDIIES
ncbi:hypothetical protein [Flammeovirga sp. OC4]|uniref:hypothetical protein n=1 Tax=Flammeovirga sp. OC4 TaxID=1382345 RepID=UPI0005C44EFB|nr:hypothetical protein [Flammeovirga sp. OC4]